MEDTEQEFFGLLKVQYMYLTRYLMSRLMTTPALTTFIGNPQQPGGDGSDKNRGHIVARRSVITFEDGTRLPPHRTAKV